MEFLTKLDERDSFSHSGPNIKHWQMSQSCPIPPLKVLQFFDMNFKALRPRLRQKCTLYVAKCEVCTFGKKSVCLKRLDKLCVLGLAFSQVKFGALDESSTL